MTSNSTNNTTSTNNTNSSANYQYASTAPSVSSILNLPQVQDKKKPSSVGGVAAGLAKTPVGVAGLANKPLGLAGSSVSGAPKGTLKLLPKKGQSVDGVSSLVSTMNIKDSEPVPVAKAEETTVALVQAKPAENIVVNKTKPTVTVVKAKVEKSKAQSHPHTHPQIQIQSQLQPHKHTKNNKAVPLTHIQPQDQFDPSHWRLFVGNLGPEVTDSLLLSTFQNPYPSCSKALIVRDWKSQKSKGFGFVAFAEGKEFLRALKEMQGRWIGNRQCIIKKSEHQPKFN